MRNAKCELIGKGPGPWEVLKRKRNDVVCREFENSVVGKKAFNTVVYMVIKDSKRCYRLTQQLKRRESMLASRFGPEF